MPYGILKIKNTKGIVTITINREKALNALNRQTFDELNQWFGTDGPKKKGLKGVIITGAGEKAFVAGADIKEFDGLDEAKATALSSKGQAIFDLIENFHVPVIAAVNGFALGGGCELAMACHMRVAGEKARFGQPEVNLGIIPGYGGTQRLIQYIGKGKAMELLLTADMIGADEAQRLGLANHVVPAGKEVAKAKQMIEKIATKAPLAVTKVIECVNVYFKGNYDGFAIEAEEFGTLSETEDFKEGAGAFVERRKANFKGK